MKIDKTEQERRNAADRRRISLAINAGAVDFHPNKDINSECPFPPGKEADAYKEAWRREKVRYEEYQNRELCPFCGGTMEIVPWGKRCDVTDCGYHIHNEKLSDL